MKDKKKKLFILVAILFLIGIGVSYAYFSVEVETLESLTTINAKTACLDVSLTEANTISLSNQAPIKDADAENLTPVTVTVTNNCTTGEDIYYSLLFTSLKNSSGYVPDNKARILVKRNLANAGEQVFKVTDYVSNLTNISSGAMYTYVMNKMNSQFSGYTTKTIYKIDSTSIGKGKSNVYKIYLWLDYWEGDTTLSGSNNNTTMNQDYRGNLSVIVNINKDSESATTYQTASQTSYSSSYTECGTVECAIGELYEKVE